MTTPVTSVLRKAGATLFRHRIVCSILSGQSIRITDIRPDDENPGVRRMLTHKHDTT
jgi:RNA 3'-terminal phosphate cyclase